MTRPKSLLSLILATTIFLIMGSLIIVMFFWGKQLYTTAFILSQVVPDSPQLFDGLKHEYKFEEVEFSPPVTETLESGEDEILEEHIFRWIDLYMPTDISRVPMVVVIPGFTPEGSRDQRLVNLATAFARSGIGVAIPRSPTIRNRQFSSEDIERVIDTYNYIESLENVAQDRIGIIGFSIGGSYALVSASKLGAKPLFVLSLGGYYDLTDFFAEIISNEARIGDDTRPWTPDNLSVELAGKVVKAQLLESDANSVLNGKHSFIDAKKITESFGNDFHTLASAMSPSNSLDSIKTDVFIFHDESDNIIPVEESRKLRSALPSVININYAEFSNFRHATPLTLISTDIPLLFRKLLGAINLLLRPEKTNPKTAPSN